MVVVCVLLLSTNGEVWTNKNGKGGQLEYIHDKGRV
jgi:hypothetical protein